MKEESQVTHSMSLHLNGEIYQINISAIVNEKTERVTPLPEMYHLKNGSFKLLGESSLNELPQVKDLFLTFIKTTYSKFPYVSR